VIVILNKLLLSLLLIALACQNARAAPQTLEKADFARQMEENNKNNQRLYTLQQEAYALLRRGEYKEALLIFDQLKGQSTQEICGNGMMAWQANNNMGRALCLERLGRYPDAAEIYLATLDGYGDPIDTAFRRMADLYTATNQASELTTRLNALDKEWLASRGFTSRPADQYPTSRLRAYLKLHALERAGQWETLAGAIIDDGISPSQPKRVAIPELIIPHYDAGVASVAAQLLARNRRQAVPLLITKLNEPYGIEQKWIYYALALCATREGGEALRRALPQVVSEQHRREILTKLINTGPFGQELAREILRKDASTPPIDESSWPGAGDPANAATLPQPPRNVKLPVNLPAK